MTPAIMEINYDLFFHFHFIIQHDFIENALNLYKTIVHVKSILYPKKKIYTCGGVEANEKSTSPELEKYIKELNITQ